MAGKASVMTADKIDEFKRAFSMGFSKAEACLYCWVLETTFYDYCSKNKDFVDLIPTLQSMPKLKAKMNVLESIEDKTKENNRQRLDDSKWYLERKAKDEFSTKEIIESTNTNINIEAEDWENFKAILKDNNLI